jgi:hypothetical protein
VGDLPQEPGSFEGSNPIVENADNLVDEATATSQPDLKDELLVEEPVIETQENLELNLREAGTISIASDTPEIPVQKITVAQNDPREGQRFIGYRPNQMFAQTEPWSYPCVSMPAPGAEVWLPRPLRFRLSRDPVEEMFQLEMRRTFPAFEIAGDDCIPDPAADRPHEPDISLVIKGLGLNLFIDVEIDEPYDRITRIPKHLIGEDRERDDWFNNKGWIVIRLAESQVRSQPKHCLAFIARVIHSVYPEYHIPSHLKKLPNPEPLPQWTFGEVHKMLAGESS